MQGRNTTVTHLYSLPRKCGIESGSQTLSGGLHSCFTPRPRFIGRQTNKNPSKCSPGEGIFLGPLFSPWAQWGKAKWTTFWVIVNVKGIRKTHVLSGIKCWLIEVNQLQHLHLNNYFLAERDTLTWPIYCPLQWQQCFLLRDAGTLNSGSACRLFRRSVVS